MADTNDFGDVGDFETPPRHPVEIKANIDTCHDLIMDMLLGDDDMCTYAKENPDDLVSFMIEQTIFAVLVVKGHRVDDLTPKFISLAKLAVQEGVQSAEMYFDDLELDEQLAAGA